MRWTEDQAKQYMAEYMASLGFCKPPGSTTQEDKADEGPESKLLAKIIKWANEKGFPVFHDRSRKKNVPGWPDITLCLPEGKVLFLELKSAKGVMRKEQKQIKQQMIYLRHYHYVVKSYKRFQEIIGFALGYYP